MTGEIPVGTWLRQETLAEQFGVSRQPVREAIRQVGAAGLVEIYPHRGALVRGPTPANIREAYLVRAELEGLAAELATTQITEDQLDTLRQAEQEFRDGIHQAFDVTIGDRVHENFGWGHANHRFHQAILDAANAPLLVSLIDNVYGVVPRNMTWSAIRSKRDLEENIRQHQAIRTAIEARDPAAARDAMRDHIRRSGELIAQWFEAKQPASEDGQMPDAGAESSPTSQP
jgi:DNA-binding GntR family transcriptional regulator